LTCCATRKAWGAPALAVALVGLLGLSSLAACASGGSSPAVRSRSVVDLTNPALGPDYSQWLVGAISRLATPEEIQSYMALSDDRAAEQLIGAFWQRRDPSPDRPGNALLETFERRSAEADRQFSESGYLGRRTARGEVYVLYGPPTKLDYEVAPREGDPPIELWVYDKSSPAGLDGRRPQANYRFVRRGDLTVLYVPGLHDNRLPPRPRLPRN
jgi:GWxTD domain-containing protein